MVNNRNIILDENQLKNLAEIIPMPFSKKTLELHKKYLELFCEFEKLKYENNCSSIAFAPTVATKKLNRERMDDIQDEIAQMWKHKNLFIDNEYCKKKCCEAIENEFSIPPITPAIMINISPEKMESTEENIRKFCNVIELYASELNSSRYEKLTYVLENGKNGDHLHAHCIFQINPKMINSVLNGKNSHIKKSHHIRQIKTHWGRQGAFGGIKLQIQCSILRTENLIEDKLNYLIHETKCIGHENYSKIMDIKTINFS